MISDLTNAFEKEKIITDKLSGFAADGNFIPECIKLPIYEINNNFTVSSYSLTELFSIALSKTNLTEKIQIQSIPITESIDTFPHPMILVTDEQELDSATQSILRKRTEKGFMTFPVILFSDEFFMLKYGESCSYLSAVDAFEDAVGAKAMVFKKSEFKYLEVYLPLVSELFKIYLCNKLLKDTYAYINKEILFYDALSETRDSVAALLYIGRIRAMQELLDENKHIAEELSDMSDMWNAEIVRLRETCDKETAEMLLDIETDNLSSFTLNIGLKYGGMQSYVHEFLNLKELDEDYEFLTENLRRTIAESKETINRNTVKLSLVGTFSSGKTTLINSFLGDREFPLRTSMAHNTAILTRIFPEAVNDEYYNVIYKDKLVWNIVKPEFQDNKVFVNRESEDIIITDIGADKYQSWIVKYNTLSSNISRTVKFRACTALTVKKGDILNPNDPFTSTEQEIPENVEICPKAEIQLIIKQIFDSPAVRLIYKDGDSDNKRDILNFLSKIERIAGKKSKIIPYSEFCGIINMTSESSALSDKITYSDQCRRIDIECRINKKDDKKILTKREWTELFGNPENHSEISLFAEQPECYMLAKELHLHLNSEFLRYCSLTDTPGFGSVTEDHDEITENHILTEDGFLLVVIAINNNTIDAKFRDLINNIRNIYNNVKNDEKDNVFFMLNCFSNLTSEFELKNQVYRVSEILAEDGFNRGNIFVCNIRDALVNKHQTDSFLGYPSYNKFHDFIIRRILSADLTEKYRLIKTNWSEFFQKSIKIIDEKLYAAEKQLNTLNEYCAKIRKTIKIIEYIEVENKPYSKKALVNIYDEIEDILLSEYTENPKGLMENIRWNAICKALDKTEDIVFECNEKLTDAICKYYQNCLDRVSVLGESEIRKPEIIRPVQALATLDVEMLRKVLNEADNVTHWYNKGKMNEYYIDKVIELVDAECAKTASKANKLCIYFADTVKHYCADIINEKKRLLKSLESEEKIKNDLKNLRILRNRVTTLEIHFNKIKFI